MPFELNWSHSFCLACDKQTDGSVFCSESCRLAEFEDCSRSSSIASSPNTSRINISLPRDSIPSTDSSSSTQPEVSTIKDLSCYSHTTLPLPSNHFPPNSGLQSSTTSNKAETNSNSSNLYSRSCHLRAAHINTNPEISQLSEESRRALRVYSNCFNQTRYSRRQPGY